MSQDWIGPPCRLVLGARLATPRRRDGQLREETPAARGPAIFCEGFNSRKWKEHEDIAQTGQEEFNCIAFVESELIEQSPPAGPLALQFPWQRQKA